MKIPLKVKYNGKEAVVLIDGIDPIFAQCVIKYLLTPFNNHAALMKEDIELIELKEKIKMAESENESLGNSIAYYIEKIENLGDKKGANYFLDRFMKINNKHANAIKELKRNPEK